VPYPVKCFGDVEGNDVGFPAIPKRGGPDMSDIGKKITSRSCLAKSVLVIREQGMGFQMFEKVRVEEGFKDFRN
jgi:hypothetical protein